MSEDLKTIKELADEIGVSRRFLGDKKHPEKSGVTCKIKKVPQRGTYSITYIFGYFTITFNCS